MSDGQTPPGGRSTPPSSTDGDGEAVGLPVPDEHVGAFVAEVFEDPERSTTWPEVVDALVAPEARDAWEDLSPTDQVAAVLERAMAYDEAAADRLSSIQTDREEVTPDLEAAFEEARRERRNADQFRDGVADAYDRVLVDGEALQEAIDRSEFDTRAVARREAELERVTSVYDLDFRPYGGTLLTNDENGSEGGPGPGSVWHRPE